MGCVVEGLGQSVEAELIRFEAKLISLWMKGVIVANNTWSWKIVKFSWNRKQDSIPPEQYPR